MGTYERKTLKNHAHETYDAALEVSAYETLHDFKFLRWTKTVQMVLQNRDLNTISIDKLPVSTCVLII